MKLGWDGKIITNNSHFIMKIYFSVLFTLSTIQLLCAVYLRFLIYYYIIWFVLGLGLKKILRNRAYYARLVRWGSSPRQTLLLFHFHARPGKARYQVPAGGGRLVGRMNKKNSSRIISHIILTDMIRKKLSPHFVTIPSPRLFGRRVFRMGREGGREEDVRRLNCKSPSP